MGALNRAVEDYRRREMSRFHMPGHKGMPLPGLEWGGAASWDVTECHGLDSLYQAEGPIREMEREYSRLYQTAGSFLSAGGSTLCIQAMLALALRPGEELLVGRGVHTAAVRGMALLNIHPRWVLPPTDEITGLAGAISPQQIEEALERYPECKAVYLTSPTYFGVISDIAGIGAVCHKGGVPLLVDNAHGAHLAFLPEPLHPIALGADLCCDSLHKSLPVLTGGAMLHLGNPDYLAEARDKLALFGSTSPSYLIMQSADAALDYLSQQAAQDMIRVSARLEHLAQLARKRGFLLPEEKRIDPLRLTLGAAPLGYTGEELGSWLREKKIEPELVYERFCVLMASGFNREEDFSRLEEALEELPVKTALPRRKAIPLTLPKQGMSLREAVFSAVEELPLEAAIGRMAGRMTTPCPPGIALVVPGEGIDREMANLLKSYGILRVNVVK